MAQVPIQGFALGERAWFADGRSGIVNQAIFNPVQNEYQYGIEGIGAFFLESVLLHSDPSADVPSGEIEVPEVFPPDGVGEFLVPADLALHVTIFHRDGAALDAALAALESRLDAAVASVTRGAIAATVELEARTNERLDGLREEVEASVSNLKSLIVTQQSGIENRIQRTTEVEEEAGEGGLRGFIGRVTGFITSPGQRFLDLIGEWFLGEVRSGLNR